MNLTLPIQYF
jgi:hypothetical protein